MSKYAGAWVGEISGTNKGNILIEIQQEGTNISGIARINDFDFGPYVYTLQGTVKDRETLHLTLYPNRAAPNVTLGQVTVFGNLHNEDTMGGQWTSSLGTGGKFTVQRQAPIPPPPTRSVFVVHGHDGELKEAVARFLERLKLKAIILDEEPNSGRTVIEKFEQNAEVDFAVILLTPDDEGYKAGKPNEAKPRARQNVILELGYFIGRLWRKKICTLYKGDVELPSDFHGIVYEPVNSSDGWRLNLALELTQAGFDIDLNLLK
ncbi:MAG: nucleotide-binding protein [Nitrospirae bacterium]|nr:nucleotide-binding protein [Nitrospirota bacterium]MDA1304271.1 nucleotide-binding protein [Nitrospirota bacterium]